MSDATNTTVPEPAADGSYDRPCWPGQWRWTRVGERPSAWIEVTPLDDDALLVGGFWRSNVFWIANQGRRWHALTPRPEGDAGKAEPENDGSHGHVREVLDLHGHHESVYVLSPKLRALIEDRDHLAAELADAKRERDELSESLTAARNVNRVLSDGRDKDERERLAAVARAEKAEAELAQLDAGRNKAAEPDAEHIFKALVAVRSEAFEAGFVVGNTFNKSMAELLGLARGAKGGAP